MLVLICVAIPISLAYAFLNVYSVFQMTSLENRSISTMFISRSYFHHSYKTFFGITCKEDVARARIERSKTLFLASGMSVGEIASECGYNNTEHYIRQFKERVGVSPGVYRKSSY